MLRLFAKFLILVIVFIILGIGVVGLLTELQHAMGSGVLRSDAEYLTPESQAQLYQAASAVGVLAACEHRFSYIIPGHADEVAGGKLTVIFDGRRQSEMAVLGRETYRVAQLSAQYVGYLPFVVVGGKAVSTEVKVMETKEDCAAPLEFLQVLMQPGNILDLPGTKDGIEASK